MNKMLPLIFPVLLLAACDKPAADNAAAPVGETTAEAAAAPAFTGEIRSGLWSATATGDMDGEEETCITPEQVKSGSFLGRNPEARQCTIVRDRMGGGVIDVEARCGEGQHPMTFKGSYTATGYELDTSIEMPVGGEVKTFRSHRVGKHVSDSCPTEDQE